MPDPIPPSLLPPSNHESNSLLSNLYSVALTGTVVMLGRKTNQTKPNQKPIPHTVVSEPQAFTSELICRVFYWSIGEH